MFDSIDSPPWRFARFVGDIVVTPIVSLLALSLPMPSLLADESLVADALKPFVESRTLAGG